MKDIQGIDNKLLPMLGKKCVVKYVNEYEINNLQYLGNGKYGDLKPIGYRGEELYFHSKDFDKIIGNMIYLK